MYFSDNVTITFFALILERPGSRESRHEQSAQNLLGHPTPATLAETTSAGQNDHDCNSWNSQPEYAGSCDPR